MRKGCAGVSTVSEGPDPARILELARRTIRRDAAAISGLEPQLDESFARTAQLLLDCTGKVLVTGLGTSGATARRVAHLLSVGGTPSLFIHAADALHGTLGAVTAGDCVIAISKGGESDELNDFVRRAHERGARIVSMTAAPESTLGRLSDQCLVVTTPDESDPGNMIAMGSALAACAMGDALAVSLMDARGYSWTDFMHSHPGGAVGHMIERGEVPADTDPEAPPFTPAM